MLFHCSGCKQVKGYSLMKSEGRRDVWAMLKCYLCAHGDGAWLCRYDTLAATSHP